jgi:hypothetical protein
VPGRSARAIAEADMASERQRNANRRNAQRSTGPNTDEGKARVAQNARRHGLLAREAVLPEEDPQDYLDLLAALHEEHRPLGPLEEFCVQEMASAQWRLRRLVRIETGFFAERADEVGWKLGKRPLVDEAVENLPKFDSDTRILGAAFKDDARSDPFFKLTRYETVIRRAFYKALETLLEARARRLRNPPPPGEDQTKPIPISDTSAKAPPEARRTPAEAERPAAAVRLSPESRFAGAVVTPAGLNSIRCPHVVTEPRPSGSGCRSL